MVDMTSAFDPPEENVDPAVLYQIISDLIEIAGGLQRNIGTLTDAANITIESVKLLGNRIAALEEKVKVLSDEQ